MDVAHKSVASLKIFSVSVYVRKNKKKAERSSERRKPEKIKKSVGKEVKDKGGNWRKRRKSGVAPESGSIEKEKRQSGERKRTKDGSKDRKKRQIIRRKTKED